MDILNQISDYLNQGDDEKVAELTETAVTSNISAEVILESGLIAGISSLILSNISR